MIHELKIQQSDLETHSGIGLEYKKIPADTVFPLHWHNFMEFEIVIRGTARHICNGQSQIISHGDAYLMSSYDFHSMNTLTDLEIYSVHFSRDRIHPDLIPLLDVRQFQCRFSEAEVSLLIQRLSQLSDESRHSQEFSELIIQNILSEIIIYFIRKTNMSTQFTHAHPILIATAYINEHFKENLSLAILAHKFSFSPNYFGQLFKKHTGRTFNDYLNTVRLKYACRFLSMTDMTVKEIALSCGYSSVEYFLYIFKEKTGMTPGKYRLLPVSR